jgi:hypothetical protein
MRIAMHCHTADGRWLVQVLAVLTPCTAVCCWGVPGPPAGSPRARGHRELGMETNRHVFSIPRSTVACMDPRQLGRLAGPYQI